MSRGVIFGSSPNGKEKIVLFYGRTPVFSNFYYCPFDLDEYHWINTEQYFQYYKAFYFDDKKTQKAIKEASTPDEHKRLGRKVKNYSEDQWREIREEAMLKATIAKVMLHNLILKNISYVIVSTKSIRKNPVISNYRNDIG